MVSVRLMMFVWRGVFSMEVSGTVQEVEGVFSSKKCANS